MAPMYFVREVAWLTVEFAAAVAAGMECRTARFATEAVRLCSAQAMENFEETSNF